MEALETRILARLGAADPYARRRLGGMSAAHEDESTQEAPGVSREQPSGLFERVRALFGLAPASVRDDIEDAIEESASEEFTPQERAILKNVLALHDVRVADVMVPRADIVALSLDTPLSEALDLFPHRRPLAAARL